MSSVASALAWRLARAGSGSLGHHGPGPAEIKHGPDAIFGNGPYPHTLAEFIGQSQAKQQIMTAMLSAAEREQPLDHVLLASPYPGIGKTALAKIVAAMLNVGYAEVGGTVTAKDIRPTLHAMGDRDVLFIDEIHRLCSMGKRNAEWLLQLLQDGVLALPTGAESVPRVTVIGATTDRQKLPETILLRFVIQPVLTPYTEVEAVEIAKHTARRLEIVLEPAAFHQIAAAADYNPRMIGRITRTARDIIVAATTDDDPIETAIKWCGQSNDGLSDQACDYLMLLYGYGGLAGIATLKAALNEISLEHTERVLIQRGYVVVTPKGREMTKLGVQRAEQLMEDNAE